MPVHQADLLDATLTVEDVAKIYCVNRRTIWRWVAQRRIPAPYRVTPRIKRWKLREIQQHLDGLPKE
jgi:predicted DNA-binding transcriptional regulator AlpA